MNPILKTEPRSVKFVVTHTRPHFDEAASLALLRRYPGVITVSPQADYTFLGVGSRGSDSSSNDPEVLFLGVCGGEFDDHMPGREEECCATLVARTLITSSVAIEKIFLLPVLRMDQSGSHFKEIAQAMIRVARYSGLDDRGVLEWGIIAATAMICEAEELEASGADARGRTPKLKVDTEYVSYLVHKHLQGEHEKWSATLAKSEEAREGVLKNARQVVGQAAPRTFFGIKLVVLRTDNTEAANVSREIHRHDIVLVFKTTGHCQILTAIQAGSRPAECHNLRPLLASLRKLELAKRGLQELPTEELEASSANEKCPWWFGHSVGGKDGRIGMVYNGTHDAALEAEPTALDQSAIERAVGVFLNEAGKSRRSFAPVPRRPGGGFRLERAFA